MHFHIITIFPELFDSFLDTSLMKRGQAKDFVQVDIYNPRDFTKDKHKKVDDIPYGGGAGMVMTCQPLFDCIEHVQAKIPKGESVRTIYMSPRGKTLTHKRASTYTKYDHVILICGRYEGIDQRVIDALVDEELSIGKYVLSGGELAAMVCIEVWSRFIPGFVGKDASVELDSFSEAFKGKKEYPHYTRPEEFRGMRVPDVLLSGHHKKIEQWRSQHLH